MVTAKKTSRIRKLLKIVRLHTEIDPYDKIHKTIEEDVTFKGSNLWILVFAILIASLGLNMNSTAVVIGAMLISPLMGPINGLGYSIATYNFPMLRRSARNFTFSVLAGLITSTIYFSLSPISVAHSEILSRTSPTIYDVLIAFIGGLAGIMAVSSKKKGNVIPGVAIATALMPPLCTAGFGLATGQMNYFFGALYLFTINTVFIGIAALAISQILKFPIRIEIDEKQKKSINQLITFVIILVLIPSIYLGYKLVKKEEFTEYANRYIKSVSVLEDNYLLKSSVNAKTNSIMLVYGGNPLTEDQRENIKNIAGQFKLENAHIELHDGFSFDLVSQKNTELENTKAELNRISLLLKEKDKAFDSLHQVKMTGPQVVKEIRNFFPEIIDGSYGMIYLPQDTGARIKTEEVFVFRVKRNRLVASERSKVEKWLRSRQNSDRVKVFYEPE